MTDIEHAKAVINDMCGKGRLETFMGIPVREFDKETLIKLITISHNELNDYRGVILKRKTG